MPNFRVQTTSNIFYSEEVTAETAEKASELANYPSLCNYCSSSQDVSDPYCVEVYDNETGDLVYESKW